jgi:excisionase family DNA binding protein
MKPLARQPARSAADSTTALDILASEVADRVERRVCDLIATLSTGRAIEPKLLDVKSAAIYLGRTEQAVQHLIFQKELPVVRVGRRVHLDRRDLDAWIEKNKY